MSEHPVDDLYKAEPRHETSSEVFEIASSAEMDRTKKPLRIALLSYRSAPHVGGQGIYVDYLSRALVERGHKVDVISGPPYPQLAQNVGLIKLASLDLYAQPHNGHRALRPKHLLSPTDTYEYFGHLSGKFVEPYTFGQRAEAYLKRHSDDYDLIIDNQSLGKGLLGIQRLGLPLLGVIHHPITRDLKLALEGAETSGMRWLIRRWYSFHRMQIRTARKIENIITPSEATKADIVAEFGLKPDQLHVVPLGVDQTAFHPRPHIERLPKRIVTTASADVPLKGLSVLLDSYASLREQISDIELIVVGQLRDGPTREKLDNLDLADVVQFRSGLSRQELAELFCSATVVVTPSLYEGFGLPCAEAMCCATPVIATNGGALPEVVGDAGIIVEKGYARALSQAILEVVSSPQRRRDMSEASYRRGVQRFSWSKIVPDLEPIFDKVIAAACSR